MHVQYVKKGDTKGKVSGVLCHSKGSVRFDLQVARMKMEGIDMPVVCSGLLAIDLGKRMFPDVCKFWYVCYKPKVQ